MRTALAIAAVSSLCTLCITAPAHAQGTPSSGVETGEWNRVQGRVVFSSPLRADTPTADGAARSGSVTLMGDYYLRATPSLNQLALTGLRATSGVTFGQRSPLWGMPSSPAGAYADLRRGNAYDSQNYNYSDHGTTPYLGIGYTGGGSTRSNSWGFSADLGVMSLAPGNIRGLGKVFNGSQNLDDVVRDLRLSPVLQFGFSYAF